MPASNTTLYAKWTINQYTITFNSNGGTDVASLTQDYNSYVMYPDNPLKNGFVFDGWYSDESLSTEFEIKSIPHYDITLYAKWSYYAIQYDMYYNHVEVSGFIVSPDYQNNIVLNIPSIFNGLPVVRIKSNAFLDQTLIISLTIPNSVQYIEEGALSGLSSLQNLTIPFIGYSRQSTNILTDQGNFGYAFGKSVYLNSVKIEQLYLARTYDTLQTQVYYYLPAGLSNLTITDDEIISRDSMRNMNMIEFLVLPQNLRVIETGAFALNTKLKELIIPDSVIHIDHVAFADCTSLRKVFIPDTMLKMGRSVFIRCYSLTTYIEFSSKPYDWESLWQSNNVIKVVWASNLEIYNNA